MPVPVTAGCAREDESVPPELRPGYVARGPLRRRHLHGGGVACLTRLRYRLRDGCGCRALWRHCGRFLRIGVRRHALTDFRPHGTDDRRHGGRAHQPCVQPRRSPDGGRPRRPPAGASGRVEDRPFRGLHASCRRIGFHVRHRRHHHADAVAAAARRLGRDGRPDGRSTGTSGGRERHRHQRFRHRRGHAGSRISLAAKVLAFRPGSPRGAGGRNGSGRAVVHGRAGYRRDPGRTAESATRPAAGRLPAACVAAGHHPRVARLGRQSADLPGGRFDEGRARAYPSTMRYAESGLSL